MRKKLLVLLLSLTTQPSIAEESNTLPIRLRIENITQNLNQQGSFLMPLAHENTLIIGNNFRIESCQNYPYHQQHNPRDGFKQLATDLQHGLKIGLQCMAGMSPAGSLHPYHERQLIKLLSILEDQHVKTFRCVDDEMYAFAVAKPPTDLNQPDHNEMTKFLSFPSMVLDTYRISGFLSGKHKPEVYRDFFKLEEEQISHHLNGSPQQLPGIHRYKNRSSLLFHEAVHWLGHEHTNVTADVVFLYDVCCFGGSDFISNETQNKRFQTQACAILKDNELWEANPYQKMRFWRYKEYNQLKRSMREHYD